LRQSGEELIHAPCAPQPTAGPIDFLELDLLVNAWTRITPRGPAAADGERARRDGSRQNRTAAVK
jgi:hypothetical protein